MTSSVPDYVLWGGSGQAKVVRPILDRSGHKLIGVFDNTLQSSPFVDAPILGDSAAFARSFDLYRGKGFVVAIGGVSGLIRSSISKDLWLAGLTPLAPVHSRSYVAESATLGVGCQIMAHATLSEEVSIGDFTIVNTGATVDHECKIGNGVHIMPGATLAGLVEVGDYAAIGSGAVILPRIKIGRRAIVGAGAVVTKNVGDDETVVGIPARSVEKANQ